MTLKDLLVSVLKSQAEFAEEMGVTRATVSRWISGERKPTIPHIRKMIDVLKLPQETVMAAIKETEVSHAAPDAPSDDK